MDNTKEYILCAAIWYPSAPTPAHKCTNMETGLVLCGHRHHDVISQAAAMQVKTRYGYGEDQGFLTSKNRFVTRIEGYEIALNQGQIISNQHNRVLYSEMLY